MAATPTTASTAVRDLLEFTLRVVQFSTSPGRSTPEDIVLGPSRANDVAQRYRVSQRPRLHFADRSDRHQLPTAGDLPPSGGQGLPVLPFRLGTVGTTVIVVEEQIVQTFPGGRTHTLNQPTASTYRQHTN